MIRAPTEQITYSIDLNIFFLNVSTLHSLERNNRMHGICKRVRAALAAEAATVESNQQWLAVNLHDIAFTTSI